MTEQDDTKPEEEENVQAEDAEEAHSEWQKLADRINSDSTEDTSENNVTQESHYPTSEHDDEDISADIPIIEKEEEGEEEDNDDDDAGMFLGSDDDDLDYTGQEDDNPTDYLPEAPKKQLDGALQDFSVPVVFELAQLEISIHELDKITNGYVFTTGKPLNEAVTISANNQTIAYGEIVQVGNGYGVLITEVL